jgi:hypothetical protein
VEFVKAQVIFSFEKYWIWLGESERHITAYTFTGIEHIPPLRHFHCPSCSMDLNGWWPLPIRFVNSRIPKRKRYDKITWGQCCWIQWSDNEVIKDPRKSLWGYLIAWGIQSPALVDGKPELWTARVSITKENAVFALYVQVIYTYIVWKLKRMY